MGRNPSSAKPAANPIISCSRIPTLMTLVGCRSITPLSLNWALPIAANIRTSLGSSSRRFDTVYGVLILGTLGDDIDGLV